MNPKYEKALEDEGPQPLANRTRFYKGFLFGEFGHGKTVVSVMCGVTTGKKVLVIYTDNGWESLFNHPDLVDKVITLRYDGLSQLTAVAEAITEGRILGGIDYSEIGMVIVDTISQIQDEYLDFLMTSYKFSGDSRVKATPTLQGKKDGLVDLEITGMTDYHMVRNQLRIPIKALVKAPVNVIFIAHLREPNFMEQAKGKIQKRPQVTEKVYEMIAREASWMGLMEADGTKRTINFQATKRVTAKSRIKELENTTINAEQLPVIMEKWSNS